MKVFSNNAQDNELDRLSLIFDMEVRKEYKNVSKHKRVLTPVVDWKINLFIMHLWDIWLRGVLQHFMVSHGLELQIDAEKYREIMKVVKNNRGG